MIRPIPFVILFLCAWFASFIVLAAWECWRARERKKRDALIIAFVQGAKAWEWEKERATMFDSDRNKMEAEAERRLAAGTIGKSPEERLMQRILEARLDE